MMIRGEAGYWESIAEEWKLTNPDRLWRKYSDASNQSLLRRWLPEQPVHRLLKTDTFDEAVGIGLIRFLQTRAHHVVGMDLSFQNVELACAGEKNVPGVCADVRRLPFEHGTFDVVVSNSTLDHFQLMEEIAVSLGELQRVLRPGGQLILTLDNLANPAIALRNYLPFTVLHRLNLVPYFVGATCGPDRLQRMVQEAGFTVKEVTALLHAPRLFAVRLAQYFNARTAPSTQHLFLRCLEKFEVMAAWPTRYRTGHFIAILAIKTEKEREQPDTQMNEKGSGERDLAPAG